MNTLCRVAFSLLFVVAMTASLALAQEWDTYYSEEFDLQFDLPAGWDVEVDGETLTALGDGIVMVLTSVKDRSVSTDDLFAMMVESLDIDAEGEYEEIELQGGILGVLGGGPGVIGGEVVGLILLAATLDENNYIVYIYAMPDAFEDNEDVMNEIITSLAPLGWEE